MQVVNDSQQFGQVSGTGPQSTTKTVTLPSPVSTATAILTGFIAEFSGGDDHHLGQLEVQVQVPPDGVSGQDVQVLVTYGLRDWSDGWDDAYDGTIFFAVVGE
jgi:hypothetical protein